MHHIHPCIYNLSYKKKNAYTVFLLIENVTTRHWYFTRENKQKIVADIERENYDGVIWDWTSTRGCRTLDYVMYACFVWMHVDAWYVGGDWTSTRGY